MLLDKKDNTYNVDKMFDYFTIKAMVMQSLETIVRKELNRRIASINLRKIDIQEDKEDMLLPIPLIIYLTIRITTLNYQHHY
jgi:hypothetical protein